MKIKEFCEKHGYRPQQINHWIRKADMPHSKDKTGVRVLDEKAALDWITERLAQPRQPSPRQTVSQLPPVGAWLRQPTHDTAFPYDSLTKVIKYIGPKEGPPSTVVVKSLTSTEPHQFSCTKLREKLEARQVAVVTAREVRTYLRRMLLQAVFWRMIYLETEVPEGLRCNAVQEIIELLKPEGDFRIGNIVYTKGGKSNE